MSDNSNKKQYNQAVKMFNEGKSLEDIWQETGFFLRQNTNNGQWEWAYRIDQNKMEIKYPIENLKRKLKLKFLINYPEFFAIFPTSKDIQVEVYNDPKSDVVAQISKDGKLLRINKPNYENKSQKQQKNYIAHELQHLVQSKTENSKPFDEKGTRQDEKRRLTSRASEIQGLILNANAEEKADLERRLENIQQAIDYLNNINEGVSSNIKSYIDGLLDSGYNNSLVEREARLAETDYTQNPYEAYNQDAKELDIPTKDFEVETKHLRGKQPQQSTQATEGDFTKITRKQFKKLLDRLAKAFPTLKTKIIVGEQAMAKRLKKLAEKGYNVQLQLGNDLVGYKNTSIQFLKTEQGEVYGFVDPENGKVYLDDSKMNANTPFHEIAGHSFLNILKNRYRSAYNEIMQKLKNETALMDEVRNDPAYAHLKNDDQIADELFARMIGNKGEELFNQMQDRSLAQKIKDLVDKIWQQIKNSVGTGTNFKNIKNWTLEDFKSATLNDILNNVTKDALAGKQVIPGADNVQRTIQDQQRELGIQYSTLNESDFNADGTVKESVMKEVAEERAKIEREAKANGTWMKASNGKKSNLNEEQWVAVRTKRFKDWFGDWESGQNLLNLYNKQGEIDYEKLKTYARTNSGRNLAFAELTERERPESGERNRTTTEVALILKADRRANPEKYSGTLTESPAERQEKLLKVGTYLRKITNLEI